MESMLSIASMRTMDPMGSMDFMDSASWCGKLRPRQAALLGYPSGMTSLLRLFTLGAASALIAVSAFAKTGWTEDYEAAKKQAEKEGKMVFIDFTGSDWCGWCIKLDKEILSKSEFKQYAKDKLVLLEVDFPREKNQSAQQKKENRALAKKYGIEGYPTLIVLDSKGEKIGELGYMKGGPKAMVDELRKLEVKNKAAAKKSADSKEN